MKKLKYVFYIKKDIAGKIGYDVLSITQKGIKVKDITSNAGQLAADYSNYQRVNVGDFAMNHMDLLTGWVDVSEYNGVTSPDYRVFNFISEKGYSRRYYLYLMQMLNGVSSDVMIEFISKQSVVFCKVNNTGADKQVLEFIYKNNMYELNRDMIASVIGFYQL